MGRSACAITVARLAGLALIAVLAAVHVHVAGATAAQDCLDASVPLVVPQLQALMQNDCFDCATYLPHLNTALQEGNMLCPLRVTAFLAQSRHETDGFLQMYQPVDDGAGALHMLPRNFRLACQHLPALSQAFAAAFPACETVESAPCSCGSDAEAGAIVQRPELTIRVGVWWFVAGAELVLGAPCSDLRLDADVGLGERESLISREHPGTGFYKVSTCIFGFATDAGLPQRVGFYLSARRVFEPTFAPPLSAHDSCSSSASHALTLSELQAMTDHQCTDCAANHGHLVSALALADMQCPLRVAALVAVVDYDTNHFAEFHDLASNRAGGVHLLPAEFRQACVELPTLAQLFADTFTACTLRFWRPCECGSDAEAAALVALPANAWLVAVWWFVHGASVLTGPVCGDLRLAADVGQGSQSQIVSETSTGTGFYHIAVCKYVWHASWQYVWLWKLGAGPRTQCSCVVAVACRYGFTLDPLVEARVARYTAARTALDPTYFSCTQCQLGQLVKTPCAPPSDTVCVINDDCIVSEWGPWTACSKTCGGGQRSRIRIVLRAANPGGSVCPLLTDVESCNPQPCAGQGGCVACASDQVTVSPCSANSVAVCGLATPTVSPLGGLAPLTVSVFTSTAPVAFARLVVTRDGSEPSCESGGNGDVLVGTEHFIPVATSARLRVIGCDSILADSTVADVDVVVVQGGDIDGVLRTVGVNFTVADTSLRASSFTPSLVFKLRRALAAVFGMHRDRVSVEVVRNQAALNVVLVQARLYLTKIAVPHVKDTDFPVDDTEDLVAVRFADGSVQASLVSNDVTSAQGVVTLAGTASTEHHVGPSAQPEGDDILDLLRTWCTPECTELYAIIGVGFVLVCVGVYFVCTCRRPKVGDEVTFIQSLPEGHFRVYDGDDGTRTFEHVDVDLDDGQLTPTRRTPRREPRTPTSARSASRQRLISSRGASRPKSNPALPATGSSRRLRAPQTPPAWDIGSVSDSELSSSTDSSSSSDDSDDSDDSGVPRVVAARVARDDHRRRRSGRATSGRGNNAGGNRAAARREAAPQGAHRRPRRHPGSRSRRQVDNGAQYSALLRTASDQSSATGGSDATDGASAGGGGAAAAAAAAAAMAMPSVPSMRSVARSHVDSDAVSQGRLTARDPATSRGASRRSTPPAAPTAAAPPMVAVLKQPAGGGSSVPRSGVRARRMVGARREAGAGATGLAAVDVHAGGAGSGSSARADPSGHGTAVQSSGALNASGADGAGDSNNGGDGAHPGYRSDTDSTGSYDGYVCVLMHARCLPKV